MIDRSANWMIDDWSSSVAVQLLAKDARSHVNLCACVVHACVFVARLRRRCTYALCEKNRVDMVSLSSLKQAHANILRAFSISLFFSLITLVKARCSKTFGIRLFSVWAFWTNIGMFACMYIYIYVWVFATLSYYSTNFLFSSKSGFMSLDFNLATWTFEE